MKIDPSDFSKLQALFLELAQALAPFEGEKTLLEGKTLNAAFLKEHLFIPRVSPKFTYKAESLNDKKKGKEPEIAFSSQPQTKATGLSKLETASGSSPEVSSLLTQAQNLLDQVRQAARLLPNVSSYAHLSQQDTRTIQFRETLKFLKPKLDELLEAVSQGDMHSAGDEPPPVYPFKMTKEESHPLRKGIHFPSLSYSREKPLKGHVTHESSSSVSSVQKRESSEKKRGEEGSVRSDRAPQRPSSLANPDNRLPFSTAMQESASGMENGLDKSLRSPSAMPFVNQPPSEERQKKKKRRRLKNLWVFEEESDPPDPSR